MSDTPIASQPVSSESRPEIEYVLSRYKSIVGYYWQASKVNKRCYKYSRFATIILSAIVTVIASLSSAKFIADTGYLSTAFAIVTPSLAALLTIVNGFSQTFQWGAAWRDMVLNAECVQSELDRIRVLPANERDPVAELKVLNHLIQNESHEFFQRIVGRAKLMDDSDTQISGGQSS
jgi:hypothetical protein